MNDEIKEILDYWQFYINEPNNYKLINVHFDEIKKVLDYITNLQNENEELKRLAEKDYTELNIAEMNATIYKSRCEKAIKYINNQICVYYVLDKKLNQLVDKTNIVKEDLLNILNGGDEE